MLPSILVAVGVWWTSNTIAHHAIHRPPFRRRAVNRAFAAVLSAATGIPQAAWRDRHLAHHAGRALRVRLTGELAMQVVIVLAVWAAMIERAPSFFATAYVPGYCAGLLLCAIHGHFEHTGGTTSHYGRLYNRLLFNDGYHVEHHMFPSAHWRDLPARRIESARTSAWPAPLRWIELVGLARLESIVLRSPLLQRWVLHVHERAFRSLCPFFPSIPSTVLIVGGGLFPRTAIVLRRLLPRARLTVMDVNPRHLAMARRLLPDDVDCREEMFDGRAVPYDLVVLPLAFDGTRPAVYEQPPAPLVAAHDWLWRRRGQSAVVSFALLKRINLVEQNPEVRGLRIEPSPEVKGPRIEPTPEVKAPRIEPTPGGRGPRIEQRCPQPPC